MRQLFNALINYKNTLIFIGLLALSLVFLNSRSFYHQSIFSNATLSFSSQFNLITHNISSYINLAESNKKLHLENEKLKALELFKFAKPLHQNTLLDSFGFEVKSARIVKNSYRGARNYLIIDKGYKDSIEVEMGVITSDGVVGIVNQVTADFSSILSVLHRDLKINARFKKNGAYGSLSWQGNHPKRMKLLDVSTLNPIAIGDTIVTGGMSYYFPYGIPIGTVLDFKKPDFEGYYDIDVELFSNLTQKEFVYILRNNQLNQLKQLNNE